MNVSINFRQDYNFIFSNQFHTPEIYINQIKARSIWNLDEF